MMNAVESNRPLLVDLPPMDPFLEVSMFRSMPERLGYTLKREVFLEGIGLMSGEKVSVLLLPLHDRRGIHMRRKSIDAWEKIDERSVVDTSARTTTLLVGGRPLILVEHLMGALSGMRLDHVGVEIEGSEIPIFDGSSRVFAEAIDQAGLCETSHGVLSFELVEPLTFESEGSSYALTPVVSDQPSGWHCVIDYPQAPVIGLQKFDFAGSQSEFLHQLSPARTFCLLEELEAMRARGLIKGGSLDNGVVFDHVKPMNPEGLRFKDEPVRHKLLDLFGDLGLMGVDLKMHTTAVRPGHRANNALAKMIRNQLP